MTSQPQPQPRSPAVENDSRRLPWPANPASTSPDEGCAMWQKNPVADVPLCAPTVVAVIAGVPACGWCTQAWAAGAPPRAA